MNGNDRDELWELLGKAKQPEVSPFFGRNVIREIRRQEQEQPIPWWVSISRLFRPAAALAAAATVALLIGSLHLSKNPPGHSLPPAPDQLPDEDLAIVADLDELLASQDSNLWIQSELSL